jgi:hypothetical protein
MGSQQRAFDRIKDETQKVSVQVHAWRAGGQKLVSTETDSCAHGWTTCRWLYACVGEGLTIIRARLVQVLHPLRELFCMGEKRGYSWRESQKRLAYRGPEKSGIPVLAPPIHQEHGPSKNCPSSVRRGEAPGVVGPKSSALMDRSRVARPCGKGAALGFVGASCGGTRAKRGICST